MATVIIPTPLRKFTANESRLEVNANTIEEAVSQLTGDYPDLKKHLLDEKGKLRSFINIFIGDEDIRDLQKEQSELNDNSVVSIVPAIAGGAGVWRGW